MFIRSPSKYKMFLYKRSISSTLISLPHSHKKNCDLYRKEERQQYHPKNLFMFFQLFTPKKCYFSHFVHHCSKRIVSLYKQRQMERTVTMNDEEGSMLLCPRKERQRMHMNQTQCPIFFLDGPLGESPKGLSEIVLGFSQFRYQFS